MSPPLSTLEFGQAQLAKPDGWINVPASQQKLRRAPDRRDSFAGGSDSVPPAVGFGHANPIHVIN